MTSRRLVLVLVVVSLGIEAASAAAPETVPKHGVEILWDKWGVPHIYGRTVADMFYGFGWAQMQSHADLLLTGYGRARGRAAEYWGDAGEQPKASVAANVRVREGNLANDRWVWTNGIPERSEQWLAAQAPQFRGYLEAFAAGLNAYGAKHSEAISEEARRVLPVSALDVIEFEQKFVNFTFVASPRLMEPTPPDRAETRDPMATDFGLQDGSNGWAIAPSRSLSGRAMLLMNPHLAWAGEQTYYEAQLQAPGVNLYGAATVGMPVLRFCFSDYVALTNTVNTNDGVDLFRISARSDGYLMDGKVLPFEHETHVLKGRQPNGQMTERPLEIRRTIHGPVIREDAGAPIAMRVAGLDRPRFLEQYWQMDTAHNFAEYQAAQRQLQVPMYNVIYADRDGHIEYLFDGTVPRRSEGDVAFWAGVVPGDRASLVWQNYLSYDELPKVIDPPNGYVQNSNEPPWDAAWPTMLDPARYPAYIAPVFPLFRSDRGLRMLSEDKKISFDMLTQKKLSTRMEMADRMLPDLLAAVDRYGTPRAKEAAVVLRIWDRQAEAESRGALLFYTWAQAFVNAGLGMGTPASQKNFAVPYDVNQPLTTPRGLKDPKMAAAMLDTAAADTTRLYGAVDAPWGKVMRLQLNGQSNGDASASRGAALNGVDLPGNGGYGGLGIFRVVTFGALKDGVKTPVHGDTITIAVEFTQPVHAMAALSYGNASQPGSPHHTDQLPLLAGKRWRPVWRTQAEIEANLEKREILER